MSDTGGSRLQREEVSSPTSKTSSANGKTFSLAPTLTEEQLREEIHNAQGAGRGEKEKIEEEYGVVVEMRIADPPFETDDIECKGYWLKLDGRTNEARVKKVKQQVSSAIIALLIEIERTRPRIVVGEG